jgi:hypothetical protein
MASVGQTPAQAPHSVHFSGSIQRVLSFSEIASTGHSLSQAPQFAHASLILYAILNLPLVIWKRFGMLIFPNYPDRRIPHGTIFDKRAAGKLQGGRTTKIYLLFFCHKPHELVLPGFRTTSSGGLWLNIFCNCSTFWSADRHKYSVNTAYAVLCASVVRGKKLE